MSKVSFIKTLSEYSESVPSQDGAIITTSDKPSLAYCVGNVKRGMGSPSWGDIETKEDVPDYFFLSGKGLTDWPSAQYSLLGNAVFKDNITSYSIALKSYSSRQPNAVLCFSPMDLTSKKSINLSFNRSTKVMTTISLIVHDGEPKYPYKSDSTTTYGTRAAAASSTKSDSTAAQTLSLDISSVTGYWYVSLLLQCNTNGGAGSISISNWTIS